MPFAVEWTDADPRYLGRGIAQYHWRCRAELGPEKWSLPFAVRVDGRVIGMQDLFATAFGTVREVHTGSWLGMAHQGRGYGTEMRAAVLAFAFDHPGLRASPGPTARRGERGVARGLTTAGLPHATAPRRWCAAARPRSTCGCCSTATRSSGRRGRWRSTGVEPCRSLLGA